MIYTKKAISPVVAIALLLVVSVAAVVAFQTWYSTYSSGLYVGIESTSQTNLDIKDLIGSDLYVFNPSNQNISYFDILVNKNSCGLSGVFSSDMTEIDLNSCLLNINENELEVVIIANNQVLSESFYVIQSFSLQSFNFSLLGSYSNSSISSVSHMTIEGNYLYISGNETFTILDISNPSNLVEEGIYSSSNISIGRGFEKVGDLIYLVSSNSPSFTILNVSNPSSISEFTSFSSSNLTNAREILISGDIAFIGTDSRLTILNISNLFSISEISSIITTNGIRDMKVIDSIYLTGLNRGAGWIKRINITDIANPSDLGDWDGGVFTGGAEMRYSNDLDTAYILGIFSNNFASFDISDILNPVLLDNITPNIVQGSGFFFENNYAYLTSLYASTEMTIVYTGDPNNLIEINESIDIPGASLASTIEVEDGNAYIFFPSDELRVIDLN